jgi:hypothetical protein
LKKKIHIKCQNGIDLQTAKKEIFADLLSDFEFIETETPDFILFGPYGNNVPQKGDYIRIGYFCENIIPDLSICEWAFGIPMEKEIGDERYKRIQWHGLNPQLLIKNENQDFAKLDKPKSKFCNFIYSNEVKYRQSFFKQLSTYKHIDAPGKSMNNMPSIDETYEGDVWHRKRQFLTAYKFTIAFENYRYPGYQTEKLYDAMLAGSIPIYFGDPNIEEIFNSKSFINASEYLNLKDNVIISFLEKNAQQNFVDIRPQFYKSLPTRLRRKVKSWGRQLKMILQTNQLDFSPLVNRIIEIDKNPDLYEAYLREPWFKNNRVPENTTNYQRWLEIFNGASH